MIVGVYTLLACTLNHIVREREVLREREAALHANTYYSLDRTLLRRSRESSQLTRIGGPT